MLAVKELAAHDVKGYSSKLYFFTFDLFGVLPVKSVISFPVIYTTRNDLDLLKLTASMHDHSYHLTLTNFSVTRNEIILNSQIICTKRDKEQQKEKLVKVKK